MLAIDFGLDVLTLAFRAVVACFETYREATQALEQTARVSGLAQGEGAALVAPLLHRSARTLRCVAPLAGCSQVHMIPLKEHTDVLRGPPV